MLQRALATGGTLSGFARKTLWAVSVLVAAYAGYWIASCGAIDACADNGGAWTKQGYCEGARPGTFK
jgi:hypothetical protein